jgi:hypothetical protein
MTTILTNLSNGLYADSRHRLNASARKFGIDATSSYDFGDLQATGFYRENRAILDQPVGMGYWLWKPYIIQEALIAASAGDIVIYADSGIEIIDSPAPLISLCTEENPILLFGNGNSPNAMWTKRDCFILMDSDREMFWNAPQCDAAFCIFRRSAASLEFVAEWLKYCCDARILTDMPNTCGRRDLPYFVEHRRDQSVLSILACKHRLALFRMPTQYGNHYKTWPYRIENEFNCVNQYRQVQVGYYALIPYYNSPYFQLLDHHRGQNKGVNRNNRTMPFIFRLIRKRYRHLVNTISFRRES